MLPVTFQFLSAMLACAINERMARKLDYVQEEVRVLKEALLTATGKTRIAFTVEQPQRLAVKGKALTPDERQGYCQLVRPATILKWFRELAAKPYDGSKQRTPGRPRKPNELRELVLRLANENVGWGYTKRCAARHEDRDRSHHGRGHLGRSGPRACTGTHEKADLETLSQESLGDAVRMRFLQRRDPGHIRRGPNRQSSTRRQNLAQ